MDFHKEEPLDLSATGSRSLGNLYPLPLHVLQPSPIWPKPEFELPCSRPMGRSSISPQPNTRPMQYPIERGSVSPLQGFHPYIPVSYPMVSPQGIVSPQWGSYPASPERRTLQQHEASVSPQRPSVSPVGDCVDEDNLSNDPEFQNFRNDAMRAMAERNGGHLVGHNPRMRRTVQTSQEMDDEYRRQRERNNFAAKQSRDRRKLREIESSLKVCFLQRKLEELKALLAADKCSECHKPCR